jgi:UDP-glucose 4-epimerase
MKVIVFGSAGYLGSRLVARLAEEGIESRGVSSLDGTGIEPTTGLLPPDFELPDAAGATVVYLSQSPRFRQVPAEAPHVMAVNSLSAVKAAVAATRAGARRFIYVSTGTVYAPSYQPLTEDSPVRRDNWYALTKLHGEEGVCLFRDQLEVVIVRPFAIYGPAQTGRLVPNLVDAIREGRRITIQSRAVPDGLDGFEGGGLRISLCHIDDAVSVFLHLIHEGGPGVINLAGPEALSIREISEAIGRRLEKVPVFERSEVKRDFDLIADVTRLNRMVQHSYISFEEGLRGFV